MAGKLSEETKDLLHSFTPPRAQPRVRVSSYLEKF